MIKTCRKCKIKKPVTEFYSAPHHKDGKTSRCGVCITEATKTYQLNNKDKYKNYAKKSYEKHKDKVHKKAAQFYVNNPDYSKNYWLETKYGITLQQKRDMIAKQSGMCAIPGCKQFLKEDRFTHVDHDHATGLVRAILCKNCNNALGLIQDNFDRALGLARYLQEYQGII